jgi:hypothetical protein
MRFKSLLFFALSVLMIPGLLQSKLFSQSVMVGVKGGLSFPQLKGGNSPQSEGYTSRSAATFGGFVNYKLGSRFTLQGEVMFSGQGGKRNGMQPIFTETLSGLPVPGDINLHADFQNETVINYLEIPVLASYSLSGKNSGSSVYVDAGPYLGILLNAKVVTNGSSAIYLDKSGGMPVEINGFPLPPQNFDNEADIAESLNSVNVGITGGIGTKFLVGRQKLILDLRAAYGLIPIQADDKDGSNNTGALYLTIGYGFNL